MSRTHPLYHPLTIGSLAIPGNIFIAPMAGFSDRAYREICARYGAVFCYTEMVSCEGLSFRSKKTAALMKSAPSEAMHGIQLFTSSPEKAKNAIRFTEPFCPSLIDLNCGCPVPKVTKAGAGSALMRTPDRIGEIVSAMQEGCRESGLEVPVTVKIRSGWVADEMTFLQAADAAIEAGAAAVTLHPRTRSQGYSGSANWDLIRVLKQHVSVPVIGSGDLFTQEDIEQMMRDTGCDAAMVARGVIGNPFLFSRAKTYLTHGVNTPEPSTREKIDAALIHLATAIDMFGESRATKEIRKHMCAYTKGIPGSAKIRARIVTATSYGEYESILNTLTPDQA